MIKVARAFCQDRYLSSILKTRQGVESYQKKRLDVFLKWLCEQSPFYARFKGKPLPEFPIMNKALMMEHLPQINTLGLSEETLLEFMRVCKAHQQYGVNYPDLTVGLSSGTSGRLGLFLASKAEQNLWAGIMLSKALKGLPFQRHKIAFCFRSNNALYETLSGHLIDFNFIPITDGIDRIADELKAYQPTILVAPARVLSLIAKTLPRGSLRPKRVISVAEVLEPDAESQLASFFAREEPAQIFQIYQCTEGFLGITQPGKPGIVLNEEYVFIEKEWIDEHRFIPIITDFTRTSQPIVRYRLDDVLVTIPPSVGPFQILAQIAGRADDVLELINQKTNRPMAVFADTLRNAFATILEVEDYRVEQTDPNTWKVALKPMDCAPIVSERLQALCHRLKARMPNLEFEPFFEIPLAQKYRRIKRTYHNNVNQIKKTKLRRRSSTHQRSPSPYRNRMGTPLARSK